MIVIGACACAVAVWLAAAAVLSPSPPRVRWAHPERLRLRDAGWSRPPAQWEGVRLGSAVLVALAASAAGQDAIAGAALGAALPSIALRVRSDARRSRASSRALDQLRVVRAALASGATLVEAIRRGAGAVTDEIAARPLQLVAREFAVGVSLSEALGAATVEAPARLRPALRTLAIGVDERLPVPQLCALSGAVIDRMAFDGQLEDEVRARTGGIRLQIWAMAALVPALALYLAATVPLVGDTLRSPLGTHLLLPTGAALEVLGIVAARRAVRAIVT